MAAARRAPMIERGWYGEPQMCKGDSAMGRSLYLQDDTFLKEMAWFPHTDKAGLSYWFLDPPILDVLERGLQLDLSAFRRLADDSEDYIHYEAKTEEEKRVQLQALRQEMDAAWQAPADLATAITRVLAVIDTPAGFPNELIAAIQALPMHNLQAMVEHAMLRGATRVRLLHR
jgi:hypothetical protein